MATLTPRGQRGITLIEIVLWCAIVAAAVVAVFVFGKKASVTAAVETEQRQVEDIVKTVDAIFATQPNFAALGTNGAVYLRERAARSGLKFQTNDDGDPILATGLGSGSLTLSSWDAVPPSGPAVPNSGYRLAYQGLAPSECSRLVTATYPVAYQVSAGQDGLNDAAATNLATRGQMTVSPAVIAENCAAAEGDATVFLYFFPARAIAGTTPVTPAPAARCNPVHETQNVACPAGQTGTITQERDGTCTGPGNTLVYTAWSDTNNTCANPAAPPPTVVPPTTPDDCTITTYSQVLACGAGQIGQTVQQRNHDTCAGTYTPWVTTSTSCQPAPPAATCTPTTESQTVACPAGQGGQIVQERSSSCLTPTSPPMWSAWNTVSNTCTASCVAAGTCCTVQRETQTVATPCPAGTYGASGADQERFLGCADAMTQSPAWTAWQDMTVSGSCTACPATSTETNTQWVARSDACPVGQMGSIDYEAEQVQTRDVSYSCPAGTAILPAPSTTPWSGWVDTGARRNTVNNCGASTYDGCFVTPVPVTSGPIDDVGDWGGWSVYTINGQSYGYYDDEDGNVCGLNGRLGALPPGSPPNVVDRACGAGPLATMWANLDAALAAHYPSRGSAAATFANNDECHVGDNLTEFDAYGCSGGTGFWCSWTTTVTDCVPKTSFPGNVCPVAAPPSCAIPAGAVFNWTVGGNACTYTQAGATTIAAGGNLLATDSTAPTTGTAAFACDAAGNMAAAPNAGATCDVVACVGTASETQWLLTSGSCAAGSWGTPNWEREQVHTRVCTAGVWGGYGPWTDTGNTRNPANPCTACPASYTETATQWVADSASCPAGFTGSNTWEKEQIQSRPVSYSCPAGTTTSPPPVTGGWSAWSDTGNTRNVVNTCTAPTVPTIPNGTCDIKGPGKIVSTNSSKCVVYVQLLGDSGVVNASFILAADPAEFDIQWSGDCSGTGSSCLNNSLTVSPARPSRDYDVYWTATHRVSGAVQSGTISATYGEK